MSDCYIVVRNHTYRDDVIVMECNPHRWSAQLSGLPDDEAPLTFINHIAEEHRNAHR